MGSPDGRVQEATATRKGGDCVRLMGTFCARIGRCAGKGWSVGLASAAEWGLTTGGCSVVRR